MTGGVSIPTRHRSLTGAEMLIADVIRGALESEGPDWLRGECGRYWLELGGLDAEVVWETAIKFNHKLNGRTYRPRECNDGPHHHWRAEMEKDKARELTDRLKEWKIWPMLFGI